MLCIRLVDDPADAVCELCQATITGRFLVDLFNEGGPVCRECGQEHAPDLVQLLKLADRAMAYGVGILRPVLACVVDDADTESPT